jgi:hypothetical protein
MTYELEQSINTLKPNESIEATFRTKKNSKSPPYITVGNGVATKTFPEKVVMDGFKVFSELSKTQQRLFVDLKDILVQQQMSNHYASRKVSNPNLVLLTRDKDDELHQSIRTRMSQNRNRSSLEEKGVLKQVKPGQYMLNPYIFIPSNDFKEIAEIWEELTVKS